MEKEEILTFLNKKRICYEKDEHKAVFNMEEIKDIVLRYPEADAKNLFISDDKKRNYYLITVKGDKKVDLKEFRKKQEIRSLSFASEADLFQYLKLTLGSVSPLGLLNDETKKVTFFLDEDFLKEPYRIGVHPCDNTMTLWLDVRDLIDLIKEYGSEVRTFKL